MNLSKKRILHRVQRCKIKVKELESKHKGNEQNYTYHGGFSLGYEKGKLEILEELLDEVSE